MTDIFKERFCIKDSIKDCREEGEKGDSNEGKFDIKQEMEVEGRRGEEGQKRGGECDGGI